MVRLRMCVRAAYRTLSRGIVPWLEICCKCRCRFVAVRIALSSSSHVGCCADSVLYYSSVIYSTVAVAFAVVTAHVIRFAIVTGNYY